MAKCVTVNRYGVITNTSSRARRRNGRWKNIATRPANATAIDRRVGDETEALIEEQAAQATDHERERAGVAPGPVRRDGSGLP
jgi:hypothetical protein